MPDIQFIRNTKYGTVGMGKNGWTKEVCNVSWNQKGPKLDLREWSPDYKKMSRGITLTKQEAKRLLEILAGIDFEEFDAVALHPEYTAQVRPVYQGNGASQPATTQQAIPQPAVTAPTPTPAAVVRPATEPEVVTMSADFSEVDEVTDISELEEIPTTDRLPVSV